MTRALPSGSGFPGPIGSVDARFTSPVETTGSLLKTSVTTAASTTIPVSAICSSVGTFSSIIEVTYATGDFTATGTPIFASSDVSVNVTCTGAVYSGDQGGSINLTAKVGETITSSAISYSNTGIGSSSDPATLTTSITTNAAWLTVTPSSSSVAPGNGSSFTITTSCVGLAAGTYSGVVTLTTNMGKMFSWTVNLTCVGSPKLVANPLVLTTKVNNSVSGNILLRNEGDGNLNVTSITGVTITTFLPGAKLEISSNPGAVIIWANAGWTVGITGTCGDTAGKLTGYITVASNDPSSPLNIGISLECTEVINLSGPASIKFASSNPSWSGPGHAVVPIQNLSRVPATYTATLNGMPRVNIVGGLTGTIGANGSTQISLEALCFENFIPAGEVNGILDILIDGVIKTRISVLHTCVGVQHAAIVIIDNISCGQRAQANTYAPYSNWFDLISPYANLIPNVGTCENSLTLDAAITQGKNDADSHLFVPGEQWESPCRNANGWQSLVTLCRRETWASAKARLQTLGFQ